MVALLWATGNREAALKLEELWNDSRQMQGFTLLGAYPMAVVVDGAADLLEQICGVHSAVIPGESSSALGNEEERRNAVFVLQRKARMLEGRIGTP
jgi:hypothetical protein